MAQSAKRRFTSGSSTEDEFSGAQLLDRFRLCLRGPEGILLSLILGLANIQTAFADRDSSLTPAADAVQELSSIAPGAAPEEQESEIGFQSTYIWQMHPAFPARYSGTNSLSSSQEPRSYTLTTTGYLGVRPWQGGELYFNPEMISTQSLSNLTGLGGLTNGENQKGGGPNPTFYDARLFLRQTWGLGGETERIESAQNQLGGAVDQNRLVLTLGKMSVVDIFDNNAFSHDPRTQFLNWSFMDAGAFDYAADARGYSSGAALELEHEPWAFRIGRFEQPKESNGLALDSRIMAHHGDQFEIEHGHRIAGEPGKLRFLIFHNTARMGSFQDALDYWNSHGRIGVPSVANVRKDQSKFGFAFNGEQSLTESVGLFARASWNDGGEETFAFTEIERSLAAGIAIHGASWARPADTVGLGAAINGLSPVHREYLAAGGLGFFIGDGAIRYRPEQILEGYYSLSVARGTFVSLDYQHIANPAYNADRGPVDVYGVRLHFEY